MMQLSKTEMAHRLGGGGGVPDGLDAASESGTSGGLMTLTHKHRTE
jgi:hypothetical protein